MKRDELYEFLTAPAITRQEIERLEERSRSLWDTCTKITAVPPDSEHVGGGADRNELLASYADAAGNIGREREKHEAQLRAVDEFLSRMQTPLYRLILKYRYVNGDSWADILTHLQNSGVFYSDRHIYRLHGLALREARKLWGDDHG